MADNLLIDNNDETNFTLVSDEITSPYTGGTAHAQAVKILSGTANDDEVIPGDASNGLDVDVTRVQGTVSVDDNGSSLTVDDGGASLTVDGTVTVSDGGSTLSVDDGGSTLTVDGSVSVTGAAADGAAVSGNPVLIAGTDGTNAQTVKTDADGNLQADILTGPAASRTTDHVGAYLGVNRLMQDLTALTPAFVAIDHATSGDNTILAAQGAGNIILVHQVLLVAASAVTVRFESGAGGTALTGQIQIAANQGFVLPFSPIGWFQTAANTLLNLELSGAVSVDGVLAYTVIT